MRLTARMTEALTLLGSAAEARDEARHMSEVLEGDFFNSHLSVFENHSNALGLQCQGAQAAIRAHRTAGAMEMLRDELVTQAKIWVTRLEDQEYAGELVSSLGRWCSSARAMALESTTYAQRASELVSTRFRRGAA